MPSHNALALFCQSFAQIWSHEQPTCCSCHLRTAHGALPEPLRFLALLADHMSAWHQCHHRSSFMANWTGAAGTGWSSPSLLWSLRFQIPTGINFNAPTATPFFLDILYGEIWEAKFTNSLLQSLQIFIRPPLWTCIFLFTITAPLGCLGFAFCNKATEDFFPKLFPEAHGFPSQALCKGHAQQSCQGSCLSLLYCFNLQRLKGGRVVRRQTSRMHRGMDVSCGKSLVVFQFLLLKHRIKKVNPTWNYLKLEVTLPM